MTKKKFAARAVIFGTVALIWGATIFAGLSDGSPLWLAIMMVPFITCGVFAVALLLLILAWATDNFNG